MTTDWCKTRLETLAVHAGHEVDSATGAVSAPIYLSTTFQRESDGDYPRGYMYIRNDNPNRRALEIALAALEGGEAAAAFSSGCAATNAILQTLNAGDHVTISGDSYYGTQRVARDLFGRWKLGASLVDTTQLAEVDRALAQKPRLIWVETPSNPLLKISDIAEISARAHAAGALCVCDNTFGPALQRPLDLGADLVIHSTTKYIGGHCDVAGGIVIAKNDDENFARIREVQIAAGAVPSPFDSWLTLRGLRTLPWRMRAHSENALALADFLSTHKNIERVHYPGLKNHPAHELAAKQMRAFSGILSFQVKAGAEEAMAVAAKTKIFIRATSLGGVESLIEHRASIEGPGSQAPKNLLRVSVGLEHHEDLIADLDQAL